MNKKTIIKSIKNHSIGQPDLCGSHYLWGFTKEVNNQVYSLKKDYGFDVPETSSKGKEVDLSTHNFISVLKNNFLSKNPKNGVYLPKPERHFQFSLTNFFYYLEKYFEVSDFRLEENLVDDEIFHFNVIENEIKDFSISYTSDSMNQKYRSGEHIYSVSLLKRGDRIFVFMVSGIDYKNQHESVKNLLTNRGYKVTFKNDPYSFKRDLYPMMSVISFNWSEVKDINPNTNPKEFQNKLIDLNLVNWFGVNEFKCDWGSVELSDENEWTPLIQHLKRWVWISSYFRYYKKIQKPSRSRVKSGSTKSWIRTNHYKTHKKFIPYEIVYTPKKVRTRLRNRYSNGCSLQERQIMGFWRNLFNPNTLGKDEYGERLIQGKTYVKPHTRMILMKPNIVSIKKKII